MLKLPNILDDPSSAKESCLDDIEALGHMPDVGFSENNEAINKSNGNSNKRQEAAGDILDVESLQSDSRGWTKSLKDLPAFSHKNNRTMPDKIAPNAYGNMKKGYGL